MKTDRKEKRSWVKIEKDAGRNPMNFRSAFMWSKMLAFDQRVAVTFARITRQMIPVRPVSTGAPAAF